MHPIFDPRFLSGTKPLVLGAYSLAVLSTMGLGALAFQDPLDSQDPGRAQQQPHSSLDRPGAFALNTLNQTLSDLRRASIAELEKVVDGQARKLEAQSLLVTSCEEGGLLAGAAVSGAGSSLPASGEQAKTTESSASGSATALTDGDVIGLVVIVHSSPTGRSAEASGARGGHAAEGVAGSESGGETTDTVPNGTYQVRRNLGESALELIGSDGRVAATIPMQGEKVGSRPPASEREDDERVALPIMEPPTNLPVANRHPGASAKPGTNDWPEAYMAILHWLDPRFRS